MFLFDISSAQNLSSWKNSLNNFVRCENRYFRCDFHCQKLTWQKFWSLGKFIFLFRCYYLTNSGWNRRIDLLRMNNSGNQFTPKGYSGLFFAILILRNLHTVLFLKYLIINDYMAKKSNFWHHKNSIKEAVIG